MIAVDTNVIIRLLTQNDRTQAAAADALFKTGEVWIAKTVLLETAWVLKSVYGFKVDAVHAALVKLLGLPNIHVEDSQAVASAVTLMGGGLELADALHFESGPRGARFISFDEAFVRRARRAGLTAVRTVRE